MKDNLIKVCGHRGGSHAEEVSSRITDIYAADTRYHQMFSKFCFITKFSTAVKSTSKQNKPDPVNLAFSCVISLLNSDPGKLCNSVSYYDVNSQSLKLLKDLIMVMMDSTMLMLITLGRHVLDPV